MKSKPELKAECIRLRTEETKSFREIESLTRVSKGSLSIWLKPYPLPEKVIADKKRTWIRYQAPKKDRGVESEMHQIVRDHDLNGVQVAKVAEAAVMLRMLARGLNVFGSVFDGDNTDWLVEVPQADRVYKIQVKSTSIQGDQGLPSVSLKHGTNTKAGARRYKKGDFDFIIGFNLFTDTAYVWSWADVEHLKAAVTICPEAKECWDKLISV